jgi:hypothetical protein
MVCNDDPALQPARYPHHIARRKTNVKPVTLLHLLQRSPHRERSRVSLAHDIHALVIERERRARSPLPIQKPLSSLGIYLLHPNQATTHAHGDQKDRLPTLETNVTLFIWEPFFRKVWMRLSHALIQHLHRPPHRFLLLLPSVCFGLLLPDR